MEKITGSDSRLSAIYRMTTGECDSPEGVAMADDDKPNRVSRAPAPPPTFPAPPQQNSTYDPPTSEEVNRVVDEIRSSQYPAGFRFRQSDLSNVDADNPENVGTLQNRTDASEPTSGGFTLFGRKRRPPRRERTLRQEIARSIKQSERKAENTAAPVPPKQSHATWTDPQHDERMGPTLETAAPREQSSEMRSMAENGAGKTETNGRFSLGDLVMLVSCALFGEPFCHAAADAFLQGHYGKAALGFAIGVPPAIVGGSFHWWKRYLSITARNSAIRIALVFGGIGAILAFFYVSGPEVYRRAFAPVAPDVKQPAAPLPKPRSRETVTELLNESGLLLDIFEKTAVPVENEWRASISSINPERICLDLDSATFADRLLNLENKLRDAEKAGLIVLAQNRIDQAELGPLVGWNPIAGNTIGGLGLAANSLSSYRAEIMRLGTHPSCDKVVEANIPQTFSRMVNQLNNFATNISIFQQKLTAYRDKLRLELRNAP